MKKIICALFACTLLCSVLAACGNNKNNTAQTNISTSQAEAENQTEANSETTSETESVTETESETETEYELSGMPL